MRARVLTAAALAVAAALLAAGFWLYTPDRSRAGLEARWAGPPSVFMPVAGLRLHVRDTGPRDAPAILLLHGFGSSLHSWEDWAAALQANRRVIRVDLPGFGLTGPDPTGDYGDARSVQVLLALLDALGVARADVVGNSMGGRIAWTLAATHPDRVRRLVLVSPDGFASPGLAYGVAPRTPAMMRALPYVLPTALLRATLAPAFADAATLTDTLLERYRDMMLVPGNRQAILDRWPQTVLVPPEPLLARIRAPTLLLWGLRDRMIPPANAADYLRAIPSAKLVEFPELGHVPQEEAPARSLAPLRSFLDEGGDGL